MNILRKQRRRSFQAALVLFVDRGKHSTVPVFITRHGLSRCRSSPFFRRKPSRKRPAQMKHFFNAWFSDSLCLTIVDKETLSSVIDSASDEAQREVFAKKSSDALQLTCSYVRYLPLGFRGPLLLDRIRHRRSSDERSHWILQTLAPKMWLRFRDL